MSAQDALNEFFSGAKKGYSQGTEDLRDAMFEARKRRGQDPNDATQGERILGEHPLWTTIRDMTGTSRPEDREARRAAGLGVEKTAAGNAGLLLGRAGMDLTTDASRRIWWLLNAPQAVTSVVADEAIRKSNPELYKMDYVTRPGRGKDRRVGTQVENTKAAVDLGILDEKSKRTKAGYSKQYDPETNKEYYTKRKHSPGAVRSLALPASLAINTGMGLTNFMGGSDGYEAALPSQDDPTKTSNVIGEVAAKYILGRTGNLLPWDEFSKVRPDVSKGEYMAYKAFKYDKEADLNPFDDGKITLPTGVLKATTEGIHGPEVQFLGRSLPVATTILPTATAIAGTALGAYGGEGRGKLGGVVPPTKTPIRRGLIGGMVGYGAGLITGNIIENERRNRNQRGSGMPVTPAYDPESTQIGL